jgi:alanine racemase
MIHLSTNRPTWAEVNLDDLAYNFRSVGEFLGDEVDVMCVVKANAYGHGAVQCAERLAKEGANWFAVATAEEAFELRQAGIASRILVVGSIWPGQEREFLNFDLTPTLIDEKQASSTNNEAAKHSMIAKVHVKIDTGMNRVGIRFENVDRAAKFLASLPNLEIEGLMTHFAVAERTAENHFTDHQIARFVEAIQMFHDAGHRPKYIDMANSPGAVMHPLARGKMVRIGGLLYGLADDVIPESEERPDVKPVMSLYSQIAMLKTVPKGESIGYGRTFMTQRDSIIATVPIGYYDGYRRGLSNKAHALVNGKIAPVVGRISMDWTTIDVTDCGEVNVGEKVTLLGASGVENVTAKDLAEILDTISYEVTCGISVRVPRIYA